MKYRNFFLILLLKFAIIYATEITMDHVLDFGVTGNYQDFDGFIDFPYLYTFSTYAFEVYSFDEDNGELTKISTLPIPGEINSIQNIDNYFFVSTRNKDFDIISSLYKIDVSNPQQPQIIASINRDYSIRELRNYNGYLAFHKLTGGYCSELIFLNPTNLEEINSMLCQYWTFAVNDTIITYVEHEPTETALLYNISDINNIGYVCSIDLSASSFVGDYIYPIGNNKIVITPNLGLSFWDISDLTNWQFLSDYTTVTPGSKWGGINRIDDFLLIPQQNSGIEVIDISDFSNPTYVSFWEFPDFFYFSLYFSFSHVLNYNNNLYIGTFQDGIFHLDFENGYIDFEDRILTDALRYTNSIFHENHLITTSYNYGSQIYDISDIQNPFKTTTILDSCYTLDQQIFDNYLIVSHYDHDELEHISLFDISNIESPVLLHNFTPNIEIDFLINPLENDVIYIQNGFPQYQIEKYDVSQPNNPQLLISFVLPETIGIGFFYNNFAYFQALTGSNNLYVYSNFENNQPILENCITNFGINNYSYISFITPYLQLVNATFNDKYYNLSDPLNPSLTFSLDSSYFFGYSNTFNNILFSSKLCTLHLYDLSNNPTGQLQPFDSILLNSWFRGLNFIEDGNTNYMLATQLECISVYEYEIVFSAVDDEVVSISPNLSNYPNPFNPTTNINYNIASDSKVELNIYNLKGQLVKTLVSAEQTAGEHTVTWNGTDNAGRNVGSGLYLYKLTAGSYSSTKKMIMLK